MQVLMEDSCGHWFTIATSVNLDTIIIPNTFEEAVKSRFSTRWHEAMVKEITDLLKNETWEPGSSKLALTVFHAADGRPREGHEFVGCEGRSKWLPVEQEKANSAGRTLGV